MARVKPDLIILDYIFGTEKSGWQMLQKLTMRRSTNTIPVIVCTAATPEIRDLGGYRTAKSVLLVPKPFDSDDLLAAVRLALKTSQHSAATLDNEAQDAEDGARRHSAKREKPENR